MHFFFFVINNNDNNNIMYNVYSVHLRVHQVCYRRRRGQQPLGSV